MKRRPADLICLLLALCLILFPMTSAFGEASLPEGVDDVAAVDAVPEDSADDEDLAGYAATIPVEDALPEDEGDASAEAASRDGADDFEGEEAGQQSEDSLNEAYARISELEFEL